jgi:hemoglobin
MTQSIDQETVAAEQTGESTLYRQLGGEAAVDDAVDIFYRKILSDSRINSFFGGVDMDRQAARQKAFLIMAFGGPHNYTGADLRRGHRHLVARGLNDSHFDAVVELLGESLAELDVAPALIAQVAAIAESTRNDVLNR